QVERRIARAAILTGIVAPLSIFRSLLRDSWYCPDQECGQHEIRSISNRSRHGCFLQELVEPQAGSSSTFSVRSEFRVLIPHPIPREDGSSRHGSGADWNYRRWSDTGVV